MLLFVFILTIAFSAVFTGFFCILEGKMKKKRNKKSKNAKDTRSVWQKMKESMRRAKMELMLNEIETEELLNAVKREENRGSDLVRIDNEKGKDPE